MKNKKTFAIVLLLMINIAISGQESIHKVHSFMSAIVTQFPDVRDVAISPLENEVYFTIQSYMGELSSIVFVTAKNQSYSKPEVASFSGKYHDLEPFFAPDGLRLYFSSNRPLDKTSSQIKDYDIWYVQRKTMDDTWSEPINVGSPVNSVANEFYPSVSTLNNLYFTSDGRDSKGKDDIFVSKWQNGVYDLPVSMSDAINSDGMEFNAFIAPDESYMIYTCYNKAGGFGSGDLYISHHNQNDQWTKSENLGNNINSPKMEYCPFVSLKSGTLYFTSRRNSINPQSETQQNIFELREKMYGYENGMSRLYQVAFIK